MAAITIDESRVGHIFRDAEGDFREDSDVNRQILIDVANKRTNLLGTDRAGNAWYAETLTDGITQVWVRVRHDKVVNGGINLQRPRSFTGLPR
jgi:filamentous hemagglutinin